MAIGRAKSKKARRIVKVREEEKVEEEMDQATSRVMRPKRNKSEMANRVER